MNLCLLGLGGGGCKSKIKFCGCVLIWCSVRLSSCVLMEILLINAFTCGRVFLCRLFVVRSICLVVLFIVFSTMSLWLVFVVSFVMLFIVFCVFLMVCFVCWSRFGRVLVFGFRFRASLL